MRVHGWQMVAAGRPLEMASRDESAPRAGEALVEVAGCGICHTDLGYLDDGVPTRGPLPLVLGHEISGHVVAVGAGSEALLGRAVVVPAVLPCGACAVCRAGRGAICRQQIFPGNDVHGGFASHVKVPTRGLCVVPPLQGAAVDLVELAVLADAITTPYQAIRRSGLATGELAIFVGVGGVGGFGVQIAAALGATVVAIDVDDAKLESLRPFGASLALNAKERDAASMRGAIRDFAKARHLPAVCWKVFETSGTPAGQELAFGLLGPGGYLGVVGFTPKPVTVRLSNLMAFDARAEGNWGCAPELYPDALALVLAGKVVLRPFIERRPMSQVADALDAIRQKRAKSRVVLVPDFAHA
ncbi:MAG: 6-hydroxycyclohex-1-ene-1-carbonyl-CoA dehydrogenase [Planctomycetes bacterium]|nr:6-hydroxycyclohex-1-ene-1-carbonyl-CoA dehydrogenase [Planctomycetota bacterium]